MAIHSSILAWRIPWTEEPGGLQSMGSQRVGHNWVTNTTKCMSIGTKGCDLIWMYILCRSCCCCLVAKSCSTLCNPMNCRKPGLPVLHNFPEFAQLMSIELVMSSNHLILCHPLLLLPSIFLSIRVYSNESALCIRWPKYWSFSFSISLSNEYSGLISFKID